MSGQRTFLARQPILDAERAVVGYELLFRAGPNSEGLDAAPDVATAALISSTLVDWNFETVTAGRPAFVNITRRLLLEGLPGILPADRVVLEVPGAVDPDPDVTAAVLKLRDDGYRIAVDGFDLERHAGYLPLARFVKVDISATAAEQRARILHACQDGPAPIAMRVETEAQFAAVHTEGFRHFQGFFFGRPELREGGRMPTNQMQLLRLLGALKKPNLSVGELEELVKADVQLCYMVLRTVNSAGSALRTQVTSIRQALVLLGRDTVRRWVYLWLLAGVGTSTHPELLAMAAARARGCELLVARKGGDGSEGFLLGMCSMLDVLLSRPMQEVLEHLPLEGEGRAALLGESNPTRHLLDSLIAYERGDWEACLGHATDARVEPELIAGAYAEGFDFAGQFASGAAATA